MIASDWPITRAQLNIGIQGNGHFMFIEKNSDQVAGIVLKWIEKNVKEHNHYGH